MTNKKLSKIEKQIENEKQLENKVISDALLFGMMDGLKTNYPKLIKKIESQAVAEYKKELIDGVIKLNNECRDDENNKNQPIFNEGYRFACQQILTELLGVV